MGEGAFKPFRQLRNQLVNATDKFGREKNLAPVLIPTLSKDMDEQLKLAHKLIDIRGSSKQKDFCDSALVKCGQARDFIRSCRIFCKEQGEREVSTICLCDLYC